MGLFENNKNTIENTIKYIKNNTNYSYLEELKTIDFNKYLDREIKEEIISKIMLVLAKNDLEIGKYMDFSIDMMQLILLDNTSQEERMIFNELLDMYAQYPNLFINNNNFYNVANSFDNKLLVLEYFKFIKNNEKILFNDNMENLSLLIGYLPAARQYYVDDRALLSSAMNLVKNIDPALFIHGTSEQLNDIINARLIEDRKANGVYDVDKETLIEINSKLEQLGLLTGRIDSLIKDVENQTSILKSETDLTKSELKESRINELKSLKEEANNNLKQFLEKYEQLVLEQRKSLITEKDLILADVDREISEKRIRLTSLADSINSKVSTEIGRIKTVSNESVKKVTDFISNNEEVKRILAETKSDDEFLAKLNDTIEFVQKFDSNGSTIITPNIIISSDDEPVNCNVNYFFDRSISFKKRFDKLMELKNKDIEENGAIYHEKFNEILTMIMQNDTPYMYGPSGCGKTFMIQNQLSKLLGIDVITNGYVLYEQDILGYTNSGTGQYVPSNFYRCFKFGNMIFFDELDNGIANATVVLNSFIGADEDSYYTFPNGERLKRNINFRIISAGNTKGTGRTLAHNTRQKMDESVMQRITPIEVNYDNRIEKKILKKYPDWYEFAVSFRKAIENIPSDTGEDVNTVGTFTTRDAETVRKYKEDNCFTDEQLIKYQIIENKDPDYLSQIISEMGHNSNFKNGGGALLKKFKNQCESMKK